MNLSSFNTSGHGVSPGHVSNKVSNTSTAFVPKLALVPRDSATPLTAGISETAVIAIDQHSLANHDQDHGDMSARVEMASHDCGGESMQY